MSLLFDLVSGALMLGGLTFFIGSALGLLRFPDFYTRMHAAGKGDTLSTILILSGVSVHLSEGFFFDPVHQGGVLLVILKVLAIAAFIMLTSPTSTHALMRAGYDDPNEPDPFVVDKDQPSENLEQKAAER